MFRRNGFNVLPLVAMLVALGAFGCSKATSGPPEIPSDDTIDESEGVELPPVGLNVTITSPAQGVTTPVSGKLELGILVTDDLKTPVTLRVEVLKAGAFTPVELKLPFAQATNIEVDTSLIPDGRKWTVLVTATRDSDATEATAQVQITVDNSGPIITPAGSTPVEKGSILGDLKVQFVVKDAGAGVSEIHIRVSDATTQQDLGFVWDWPTGTTKAGAVKVDTGEIVIPSGSWTAGDKVLTVTSTDGIPDHNGSFVLNFSYSQVPRFQGGTVYALPTDVVGSAIAGIHLGLASDNTGAVVVSAASGLSIFTRDAATEKLVKKQDLMKTVCGNLVVQDLDGDGLDDVVAVCNPATGSGHNLNLFLQTSGSTFAKPVVVTVPSSVTALALGDLNGDGRQDVALALTETSQTVGVVLSNFITATNTLTWEPLKQYGGAQDPRFIAIGQFGDLTGVGDARENAVVVAPSGSSTVTRFIADSKGLLSAGLNSSLTTVVDGAALSRILTATTFTLGSTRPQTLLAFGDGERDRISLFRAENPGSSTVLNGFLTLPAGVQPARIQAGDLDGDGVSDVAVLCKGGNLVHLFSGSIPTSGNTFLVSGPSFLVGSALDMTLADVDDDGVLDIVTLSSDGKSLTWLKNSGKFAFSGAPMVGLNVAPISIAAGRFSRPLTAEKTRLLDVAVLGTQSNKNVISVFTAEIATGMALTQATPVLNVDVASPRKLLAANLDPGAGTNTGLDDLVVAAAATGPTTGTRVTGQVFLLKEDGVSHTKIAATPIANDWGDSPNLVALGDFSSRPASEPWRPDLVTIATFNVTEGRAVQIKPFINQNDGSFTTRISAEATTKGVTVDSTRSQRELVAAPLRLSLYKWIFKNVGQRTPYDVLSPDASTGDFTVYASSAVPGYLANTFKHFAVGANPKLLAVAFLAVPVDGSLPADQQAKALPDVATLLDQDVVISYNSSDAALVLSNPDLLSFEPPVSLGHKGHGPVDLALADMNHDGNIDILVLNSQDSTVSIYLNLGSRNFSTPYDFATGVNPQQMIVADLDGNGCPDIVTVDATGKTLTYLKNIIPCAQ